MPGTVLSILQTLDPFKYVPVCLGQVNICYPTIIIKGTPFNSQKCHSLKFITVWSPYLTHSYPMRSVGWSVMHPFFLSFVHWLVHSKYTEKILHFAHQTSQYFCSKRFRFASGDMSCGITSPSRKVLYTLLSAGGYDSNPRYRLKKSGLTLRPRN